MPIVAAASQAARRENNLRTVRNTAITARNPASAGHRRVVHSSSPATANIAAVTQYCSGGFSKYGMPLRRGVTQSPVLSISRGISA